MPAMTVDEGQRRGRKRPVVILLVVLLTVVLINLGLNITILGVRNPGYAGSSLTTTAITIPVTTVRSTTTRLTELVSDAQLVRMGNQLWGRDSLRAKKADIRLHLAGNILFEYVKPEILNRTSFVLLSAMFDNYEAAIGVPDLKSAAIDKEIDMFLNYTINTSVMKHTWQFLARVGLASKDLAGFKEELKQYWFQSYSRSKGVLDSSGFEHVFVGQTKQNSFSGFHNWLFYYLEEQAGRAQMVNIQKQCKPNALTFEMKWMGRNKPKSGFVYGVTPEFEMALFTLCFRARPNGICKSSLGGFPIAVRTYVHPSNKMSSGTVATAYVAC